MVGILQTIVYYRFQQIYASFIIVFITSSICVTAWTSYLTFVEPSPAHKPVRLMLWKKAMFYFVVLAASVWLVDFHLCDMLMPYYLHTTGFTLHVLWHVFSCMGTYYCVLFLVAVRMQVLKLEPHIDHIWGFIPVCTSQHAPSKVT